MKRALYLLISSVLLFSCDKTEKQPPGECDINATYLANAAKVTITSGVWGTTSAIEGNCMPPVGPGSGCTHCPVKRTVKLYQYTLMSNAIPSTQAGFYESFNTQLITQVTTDNDGFFQMNVPAGQYTIVIVENGKLYAPGTDSQGGLNPVTFASGILKADLKLTYKAVF